ncbi:endo-1,4-beta-xylanase [Natronobiforma cellulositropha]|uniref:endo-1,4-beta-xylanase n=1 Tax=Natronobiforma cellulositropha TaxID=1679076 RepID=UPI0021D57DFD|nr:endo-1,4-beta-xylanase [Natronobiforma cellulositropha]
MTTNDRTETGDSGEQTTVHPPRHRGPSRSPTDESTADSSDGLLGSIERRDYLRAMGAAGLLGALGAGSAPAASAYYSPRGEWEADADARIQEHRTSDVDIVVEDGNGNAVSGADVSIEMQEHDYGFGTAVAAELVTRGTIWGEQQHSESDAEQYREYIPELFNKVVFENLHKWGIYEDNQEIADETVEWMRDRDLEIRGHVCLWGNVDAWAIPPDVVEAMGVDWQNGHEDFTAPDHDPDYVVDRSMEHIETIIEHYGNDIAEWEVVNEVIHETEMIEAVDGHGVDPVEAPILADWYLKAQEVADQYDIPIAVNDYNTLVGPYQNTRDDYNRQIEFLLDNGVDLDGIGFQCHFGDFERITSAEIMDALDDYSQHGVRLRATEFDTFQGDWTREEQADYLYEFMKTFFSHPNTDDFLIWGFWDGEHWGPDAGGNADAPLFEEDWTPKPAYDVWMDLVFDEWWTDESGTTDTSGTFSTTAFLGEHEVTVSAGGETTTETVYIDDSSSTTITINTDGEGPGPDPDGLDVNGNGMDAQDLTGDGLYEDITGDGNLGFNDVVTFFEEHNGDVVQSNVEYFDFSGSGSVGFNDVVSLFERL